MASEQLVVLTDELYAGVLSSIDACARDTGNPATTVKLSKIVKRALEASRNSTGSKEASLRRGKIRAFGDEHFEQDIGLGTLACQVLVSSSSERRRILPKGSIADGSPSFSLKKSFRLIPVQLRHVCLPLHAAIQAFSVLENMGGFAGRSDLPRLAKSITLGFMELESIYQHISRSASGHQVLLDPRKFVARESHGDTAIILECVVTLSGMGLHRAEAELSAIMLAAWDAQTACHPNELDHGSRRPKSVDHSEEYDCENLGQRVVRRNAISRLIGARVARAEAKAVAQEQAWASARAQEERALRGAVGSRWIAPAQMAPTWRYEPLLDQWVATRSSDGPTGSDGERLSKSKHNRGTPRVSSSDPSVRPITAQDEEGDDAASQSEAESVSSNLRFTGGPSNPYAHAMQAIEGQKKPKRTEPGPDDEDNELDEMDLFNRRTPVAKRRRRPPQRYNPQEEERRSKGKGKDRA
ncbi:unnamed protein product [Tilletia controversa]|nr:unnamed protein product [Tilletia controversa]